MMLQLLGQSIRCLRSIQTGVDRNRTIYIKTVEMVTFNQYEIKLAFFK